MPVEEGASYGRCDMGRFCGGLLLLAWVSTLGEQPAGVLATVAGQGQSDLRIHPERQALLLAAEAVLQSPPTATCR